MYKGKVHPTGSKYFKYTLKINGRIEIISITYQSEEKCTRDMNLRLHRLNGKCDWKLAVNKHRFKARNNEQRRISIY